MKKLILSLLVLLSLVATSFIIVSPVRSQEVMGPRSDYLLIKIYYDPTTENWALDRGEIDINDWPLSKEWVDRWITRPEEITLRDYAEIGMFEFDINNQRWPTGCPEHRTFDPNCEKCLMAREFRRALAHLVDKERIISEVLKGFGYRLDTPVPFPALAGWTDYAALEEEGLIYNYDPEKAAQILDAAGFKDTDGDGIRNDPLTGENLEPLEFYIRQDDPNRRAAGEMFAEELKKIGIPVNAHVTERTVCYKKVMVEYDYHLYTGGWSLSRDPDFLYDLYHSSMYWGPEIGWSLNYPGFVNEEYDAAAYKVKYGATKEEVMEAALEAQKIFAENVPIIPLWSSAGVKAYRTGWTGVVNEKGFGIDNNPYTWMLMYQPGKDTIKWGFKSDIEALHVVSSEWLWDWLVLGLIYDPLLAANPYNLAEDVPMLATSWDVGTWEGGLELTFYLRQGVTWHDGTPFTADDVKFTIDFIKKCGPGVAWNYVLVEDVNSTIVVDDYTIKVRLNSLSYWGLHWIGGLPIMPKHIWEGVTDSEGRTWTDPDWDPMAAREFHPWEVENGMVGTGPWIFVNYVPGESVLLKANRNYYRSADEVEAIVKEAFHGIGDVDYNGVIEITDLSMIARALGTDSSMPEGTGWDEWNPACDLNNDGKVDLKDLFLAGQNFGMVTG